MTRTAITTRQREAISHSYVEVLRDGAPIGRVAYHRLDGGYLAYIITEYGTQGISGEQARPGVVPAPTVFADEASAVQAIDAASAR